MDSNGEPSVVLDNGQLEAGEWRQAAGRGQIYHCLK